MATCYVEVREVIVFGQASFLEIVESIDEQRPLIDVVGFGREPPFINFSPDRELPVWSKACLDAFDSV